MTTLQSWDTAPTLEAFNATLSSQEDPASRIEVPAGSVILEPSGDVVANTKSGSIQLKPITAALTDMAQHTGIPLDYFVDRCPPALRAASFNTLRPLVLPDGVPLHLVVQDNILQRVIKDDGFTNLSLKEILDAVSRNIPPDVPADTLKVIEHHRDVAFDITLASPRRPIEPRPGDVVATGLNVNNLRRGAIQVNAATYRLRCANGAICRACDSVHHYIRRSRQGAGDKLRILQRLQAAAALAWAQYAEMSKRLSLLDKQVLSGDTRDALSAQLRRDPFRIHSDCVGKVFQRLGQETGDGGKPPTFLDLWNATSYVGSHDPDIAPSDRIRLRYAAGAFIRSESRFCETCSQLVLT